MADLPKYRSVPFPSQQQIDRIIEQDRWEREHGIPTLAQQIAEQARHSIDTMAERAIMGLPMTRLFVCQECGKTHELLHGNSIICGCGARSSAEIL